MLISKNLRKKSSEVSIKTRSIPASLSFIGQVTKHATVKWSSLPAEIEHSQLEFFSFCGSLERFKLIMVVRD